MKRILIRSYKYFLNKAMNLHRILFKGIIKINDLHVAVPKECSGETYFKIVFGKYELPERQLLKFLSPNDKIIELGGSIGVVSNSINKLLSKKEDHIVLEPNPLAIFYSEMNKSINNSKYKIIREVVGSGEMIKINLSFEFIGSSQFKKYSSNAYSVLIYSNPINKYINMLSDDKNLVLIMDIEGAELDVVFDESIIKFSKIILERHPGILLKKNKIIDDKLLQLNFSLIDSIENVQYWSKE